jgi:hypothetical protein
MIITRREAGTKFGLSLQRKTFRKEGFIVEKSLIDAL